MYRTCIQFVCLPFLMVCASLVEANDRPNVVLVMTDDQGYGDVAAHGNPVLKTPSLDQLYSESVRFTDFHVAPMCTPTRGQLMSGMDAMRNLALEVNSSRSMLRSDLKIMPQYFKDAGYATGMFGKWHLGDSYPFAPRFRGFDEVLRHRHWGITSSADYWDNTYFNPVLEHNGVDELYKGYCTDIFFDAAMEWMADCQDRDTPFFVYLPTNTPHVPDQVAKQYTNAYRGKYKGKKIPSKYYGMIANIDENMGKLESFLQKRGLKQDTIVIFLSDNGTQSGAAAAIHNAGMRGIKTSLLDGGHRVPLFFRWPKGGLHHGSDISELAQVQDLVPTLAELCQLDLGDSRLDGVSLAGLLKGTSDQLPDRKCIIQYCARYDHVRGSGKKWEAAAVMHDKWRLVHKDQLYNIADDPGQKRNLIDKFPTVAQKMAEHYEEWYNGVAPNLDQQHYVIVGSEHENPVKLFSSEWKGDYCANPRALKRATAVGYWPIEVDKTGTYKIKLRRWPEESGKKLTDSFDGVKPAGAVSVAKVRLKVGDFEESITPLPEAQVATFTVPLATGRTQLTAELLDSSGEVICGAMYVSVELQSAGD